MSLIYKTWIGTNIEDSSFGRGRGGTVGFTIRQLSPLDTGKPILGVKLSLESFTAISNSAQLGGFLSR